MTRRLTLLLVVNLVLSLAALGWLTWITVEPRYWFEDAYAEKGPRGDIGPRGPGGLPGPQGPVGPDAEEAVGALDDRVTELEGLIASTGVSDVESRLSEVESSVSDVESTVSDVCTAFSGYEGAFGDIYLSAC